MVQRCDCLATTSGSDSLQNASLEMQSVMQPHLYWSQQARASAIDVGRSSSMKELSIATSGIMESYGKGLGGLIQGKE